MISISKEHYSKLIELVRVMHHNSQLIHPSNLQISQIYDKWLLINEELIKLSARFIDQLDRLRVDKQQLVAQTLSIGEAMTKLRGQNSGLTQSNTLLRADLSKYQAQINMLRVQLAKCQTQNHKLQDGFTRVKQTAKQKIREKEEEIIQLQEKVKKYKRVSQEHKLKVDLLDKKISELQVVHRAQAKDKELDQSMERLQAQLEDLYDTQCQQFNEKQYQDVQKS